MIVVTGAESGIGHAVAVLMLERGYRVIGADIRQSAAEGLDSERYTFVSTDVTKDDELESLFQKVEAEGDTLDALFNCAGVTSLLSIPQITPDEWDRMLAVNLRAVFFSCQMALRIMISQGRGNIVNVASNAARGGGKTVAAHYCASKAGVISVTQSLALYGAEYNVRVNCVAPGTTATPMTADWPAETVARLEKVIPLKRFAQPMEVARAMAFLASDEAEFITGETLNVNGGLLMY